MLLLEAFIMDNIEEEFLSTLDLVFELDDLEEIGNVVSLFLYNNKVMPGTELYEEMTAQFYACMNEKLNIRIIKKFRKLLDEL